ncbi:Two component transcriptional regulator, winged helix family [uncultured Sphingopyxis sp.]|uniref:Two component transcriptional regulator, winged helix family n=1 Tax=uncultured Sphingopyxis sp. TaxID=310581 RepID=A0A1Y5Q2M3_9SPHN|nr:response regulator transcription factor [uncultured Sphingopyxis sp.]SBV35065.1 Two component transcriptional regulator, winged helix family [uncultured Sphingopyxis sp.]
MRIAILEDDREVSEEIASTLDQNGHNCTCFDRGQKLINRLKHDTFDVLLIDWNLPDFDGLRIIGWVKENVKRAPPMIVLTSRTADEDIVAALEAGADDYVIKPPLAPILLARISAVCRRTYPEPPASGVEMHGEYIFNTFSETVLLRGEAIPLTKKEFGIALILFRNIHRTLSREYLFQTLWGASPELQTRTLDAHVSKVRNKLNLRAANGYRLSPIYAFGYRLEKLI